APELLCKPIHYHPPAPRKPIEMTRITYVTDGDVQKGYSLLPRPYRIDLFHLSFPKYHSRATYEIAAISRECR
ncbi:hypothetical protein LSAT2_025417, partial [Lamellibrachia satsuma]